MVLVVTHPLLLASMWCAPLASAPSASAGRSQICSPCGSCVGRNGLLRGVYGWHHGGRDACLRSQNVLSECCLKRWSGTWYPSCTCCTHSH